MLALCLWREARNQSRDAKLAVGEVIHNRATRDKVPYDTVVLAPWQFSSFNAGDPNAVKLPDRRNRADWQAWVECAGVVDELTQPGYTPILPPQTYHYHDKSIAPPKWAQSMREAARIGDFIFYV